MLSKTTPYCSPHQHKLHRLNLGYVIIWHTLSANLHAACMYLFLKKLQSNTNQPPSLRTLHEIIMYKMTTHPHLSCYRWYCIPTSHSLSSGMPNTLEASTWKLCTKNCVQQEISLYTSPCTRHVLRSTECKNARMQETSPSHRRRKSVHGCFDRVLLTITNIPLLTMNGASRNTRFQSSFFIPFLGLAEAITYTTFPFSWALPTARISHPIAASLL